MYKSFAIIIAIALQTSLQSLGQSVPTDPKFTEVEEKFFEALKNKNYNGLEDYYDDSFTGVLPSGKKIDKAGMIDYHKTNDVVIFKVFESLETRVYGDVAICSGIEINKVKSGSIVGRQFFILIFLKKENTWRMINSQFTSII